MDVSNDGGVSKEGVNVIPVVEKGVERVNVGHVIDANDQTVEKGLVGAACSAETMPERDTFVGPRAAAGAGGGIEGWWRWG